jgi:hypothetical protein
LGRKMVALVDNQVAVFGDPVIHHILAHHTLDQSHVDLPA